MANPLLMNGLEDGVLVVRWFLGGGLVFGPGVLLFGGFAFGSGVG